MSCATLRRPVEAEAVARAAGDSALLLRPAARPDRERMRAWRNSPAVARHMYREEIISAEQHAQWFERALADPARRYWIIVADGVEVGVANLYDIDRHHRRCYWAFYIGESDIRGKGIGSFVEYAVLAHVFEKLALNRLCCEVLSENEPVWRMHEKCGFTIEGTYRRHIRKGEDYHDVVALAMLAEDWQRAKPALLERLIDRGLAVET